MYSNAKTSELLAVLATIDPATQAVGTVTSGWVSVANFHTFLAMVETGVLGTAATLDVRLQQALDSVGTSAKDVANKTVAQLAQAANGSSRQIMISLRPDELDTVNGFGWIRLVMLVGTAASFASGQIIGLNPRYLPANSFNQPSVAEVL